VKADSSMYVERTYAFLRC